MMESLNSQNKMPKVMIGIINYNRSRDTIECIRSLQAITYPNTEIVILDSASTDDSVQQLQQEFPTLALIRAEKNNGPAGSRNIMFGVAKQKAIPYLLMLDNDTIVEREFLEPLVQAMEGNANAVIAGGTILEYENRDIIWFGGGRLVPWRGLAVHEHKDELFDRDNPGKVRPVTFITSCLILFKLALLEKIGGQDERFFPRFEDIEHSARAHRLGYTLLFVPQSVIYHKVAGELNSTFKLYYSVRNRFMLIRFGFGGVAAIIARLYFLTVITGKMIIWSAVRREYFIAARAGLVDYFKGNLGEGRGMTEFADERTSHNTKK